MTAINSIFSRLLSVILIFFSFIFFKGCHFYSDTSEQQKVDVVSGWKKIGPGGGGSTFIPTFSYETPEKYLVRCDMTGTYLTDNGGVSYRQINFSNGAAGFAFDPLAPGTLYIGSSALHKSTDGGKTWIRIFPKEEDVKAEIYRGDHADYRLETSEGSLYSNVKGPKRVRNIRVDPLDSKCVYFSIGSSFFYTTDGATSWSVLDLDYPVDFIYTNEISLKEEVYIFTSHEIGIFNKATKKVEKKTLPMEMIPAYSFTGGMVANDEEVILYALQNIPDQEDRPEFNYSQVWISRDLGKKWESVSDPLLNNRKFNIKPSFSRLASSEYDANHAYIVCNRYVEKKEDGTSAHWYGALKTSDAGEHWEWVWKGGGGSGKYGVKDGMGTANLSDSWVEEAFGGEYIRLIDVGVAPQDGQVAIVTDWYRTMKTVDGGKTWREVYSEMQPEGSFVSRGMDVTTAYGVHPDPFDENHLAISYTDIGYHHSFDGGRSWVRSVEGVPAGWRNTCYWLVFDPDVEHKLWSVWSNLHDFPRGKMTRNPKWKDYGRGGVCVSIDGGKTWQVTNEGIGENAPSTSIVLDPNSEPNNRTLYVSVYNKGVFKSTDDGKTWTMKNNGIKEGTGAFELTIQEDGTLFLVVSATPAHRNGEKGREVNFGGVYKSIDGAETWTKLKVSDKALFPNGLDYDPRDPGRIYVACWSDVMLSDLVGRAVTEVTGGNEILDFDGGVFMSEDGGESWRQIFDQDQYVYDVTIDAHHEGRVYCNTFNKAAYRSDNYGKTWKKLKDYDFHWGHRVIVDQNDPGKVFLTTFGSSVWHGAPLAEAN
ncbi:hypothetical protein QQ020_06990 [Fulvivirgaceae bacterium BMA12]|uniref:Sortilin N-terminal domain-containing protein n=1 Tax=Agaribacillus aureus TaxID=3051825 RepID=A0ABT8L6C9_9BACT|nr:hypothetical protein [Fulvivirgaceae bacterium BMA12]